MKYIALFVVVAALAVVPGTRDLIAVVFLGLFLNSVWRGPRSSEVVDS